MNNIRAMIQAPDVEVVSFDVFDTLLLRPFSDPADVFSVMQADYEEITGRQDAFSALRKQAEKDARAAMGRREDVALEAIYRALAQGAGLEWKTCQALMRRETEREMQFIRPREAGAALFRQALACGKRVVLISDMYLSAGDIGQMLKKCGISGWERIFVSCEAGKVKSSGRLFRHAARVLGVRAGRMLHIGDHPLGDGEAAGWTGLRSSILPRPMTRLHGMGVSGTPAAQDDALAAGCLQALTANRFLSGEPCEWDAAALLGYAAAGPYLLAGGDVQAVSAILGDGAVQQAQAFAQDWQALSIAAPEELLAHPFEQLRQHADLSPRGQAECVLRTIAGLRPPCRQDRPISGSKLNRRVRYELYRFPMFRRVLAEMRRRLKNIVHKKGA